jgi:hypothetical protein
VKHEFDGAAEVVLQAFRERQQRLAFRANHLAAAAQLLETAQNSRISGGIRAHEPVILDAKTPNAAGGRKLQEAPTARISQPETLAKAAP